MNLANSVYLAVCVKGIVGMIQRPAVMLKCIRGPHIELEVIEKKRRPNSLRFDL